MTTKPLSHFHLSTLYHMLKHGPMALRKGEVARLVKLGLITPGTRGQYGMTYYTLTAEGKALAATITMGYTPEGRVAYTTA